MSLLNRGTGAPTSWRNWARSARCTPDRLIRATHESDLVDAVRYAADRGLVLRAAGTGHSFNPLVTTGGVVLDMTGYTGIVALDPAASTVTVRGGTLLRELNWALDKAGLALSNMGTLEYQTIAGAISTGNHGSGIGHRPFSGQVIALTLVTADGTIRSCGRDEDPELFAAAATSLGALGVISTVTLQCVPRYNLRVTEGSCPLDSILEDIEAYARSAEHATFSLKGWSDSASTLKLNPTDAPPSADAERRRRANTLGEVRCTTAGLVGRIDQRAVRRIMTAQLGGGPGPGDYVDVSYNAFTFPQPVKFLSLEYALPLTSATDAVRHVHEDVKAFGLRTPYSVTVRFSAGDDLLLSPAHGRTTAYVNITVPRTVGYTELLRTFEAVLLEHEGRPHWGKAHTATAELIADRYPGWKTFQDVRAELDPSSLFTSDYLRRVLGGTRTGR
ncbi:FAD-binding protein [Streptomyces sp. NBC_01020]|uniref:D-arabinono-1,4-lactone oxidase n=1 Tax=unclassified Streptomyces TaxID=2593676 RepID=UPI0032497A3B|nr:FAD-binding protein [Streptomyces sp. NBC_01020]WSX66664.1 FAD-binding protein [Streptomyces sp. NBC_00932]